MTLALFILLLPVVSRISAVIRPDIVTSVALLAALAYALQSARVSGLSARAMYWAVVCALLGGSGAGIYSRFWYTAGRADPSPSSNLFRGARVCSAGFCWEALRRDSTSITASCRCWRMPTQPCRHLRSVTP